MSYESKANNRVEGTIVEVVPNDLFRVRLVDGRWVLAHMSEEARVGTVRLVPGERVLLELTAYDLSRARIVGRAGESR